MTATPRRRALIAGVTALAVGALTALQSRVNGELASVTQSGLQAALVSFGTGWILLTVIVVASPSVRRGLTSVREALRAGALRWWQVIGGVLGGFFVAVQSATVPLIGVAVFTVAVVAGQVSNSIVVDRLGLGPAGRQAVTPTRVVSAILAVAAVIIAVSDRLGGRDAAFDRVEDSATVERLLTTLPERERTMVEMRFFDGLSQSQIAERMGISQMHVSRLLAQSLTRLRDEVGT